LRALPIMADTLPDHWSYGVCRDGRVFFINDQSRSTTWLHPRTGEPVNSGHMMRSDLPQGWEEGFTEEGASFFINHNQRTTTFRHPVTGEISPENIDFFLQEHPHPCMSKPESNQRPPSVASESSTAMTSSTVNPPSGAKGSRSNGKVHSFGKRDHAIKRDPNVPAVVRGWLYKQDSSGMRLWKRKWFVLADHCLFYYKDSREEAALGSIPLPSYAICPVEPADHISRKYAFKACHTGMRAYIRKDSGGGSQAEHSCMRTYFFSADTQQDMNGWIRAMNQAALLFPFSSLSPSEHTLPRRTPPTQPKAYQSLPKTSQHGPAGCSSPVPRNLPSDYKYAADRVSHLRMSADERVATKEGTVWQLYEWQQRQQFRHGSPTAPLYADASAFRITLEVPRSMSVPPSPSDIPPPGPTIKVLSPRRPHVPANRVTVRPVDEASAVGVPASVSPRHMYPQHSRVNRRSVPPMGYMTHTVSAPSLHGKTADDTYLQLKSDLEYLDLKVGSSKPPCPLTPFTPSESFMVKLSRLCEQDKVLQELESRIRSLKEDKDKLESVLDVSHQQMEQYRDQPAHAEKIAYQQKLLQEDVVHIRAEMSRVSTEMEKAWNEYSRLESDLHQLRESLQDQMHRTILSQQEKAQMRKELWRMEDVMAGLSSSKAIYKVTVDSVKNPERKLVPSISAPSVPSLPASAPVGKTRSPLHSPHLSPTWPEPQSLPSQQPLHLTRMDSEAEDDAPPRPPLPQLYSPEENPPAVPPLPKEASAIRHTSVRGLKRQSDERKRDREFGQYINGDYKVELRSYVSEPELENLFSAVLNGVLKHTGTSTLPGFLAGLAGSTSRLNQSTNISSFVTLRRGVSEISFKVRPGERPKSALERLYPGEAHHGGRMSAEEQLERMKRHQKALVRERKRNLSQSERQSTSSRASAATSSRTPPTDLGSWKREQDFDMQLLERAVQGAERPPEHQDNVRPQADEWLTVLAKPLAALDLEPVDFELDLQRELSTPQKVFIPQRATEPEEPLSQHDAEARYRKAERISGILAQSSVQNMLPPEDPEKPGEPSASWVLQERMVAAPYVLASEASLRNKEVTGKPHSLDPPYRTQPVLHSTLFPDN
uniref:Pleckstrin homology domain containing A7 n=1 Tax=Scleropages formosus TaxID=113540 RepID=A0A8C9RVK2_SCLFO